MIADSGERREFETGAVRDMAEGKGRCDLMPLDVVAAILSDSVIRSISNFQMYGERESLLCAIDNFICDNYGRNAYAAMLEVSKHFEEGAKKYGEYNWQKGLPEYCYIDSAVRHYLKYKMGETSEPHDRAFMWNIMCLLWTNKHITGEEKEKENE